MKRLAQRVFTLEDQVAFAELSGDRNPIHVDPVMARRYMFGEPVVHGVHAVLWALDNWFSESDTVVRLRSLRVNFLKPIGLDVEVVALVTSDNEHQVTIELECRNALVARIVCEYEPSEIHEAGPIVAGFPEVGEPRVISEHELETDAGNFGLFLHDAAARRMFPNVMKRVQHLQVAILLATTRLVGMECPGMHSVYSALNLRATDDMGEDSLRYEVARYDRRFRMVLKNVVAPGMTGTIKSFTRPAPASQPAYTEIVKAVEPGEFAHQDALIIGGSRGLGEVVAKLLCAGGARVRITYFRGEHDAQRIVDEVAGNGGNIDALHYDVLGERGLFQVGLDSWTPTYLYFFATPFISSSPRGTFSKELFESFCDYYVSGFMNAVTQLENSGLTHILYPSSVYVTELPPNLGEYAAAKVAGETLCEFIGKTRKGMSIYKPRLPRMATDQTASLVPSDNRDPATTMLQILRSFPK